MFRTTSSTKRQREQEKMCTQYTSVFYAIMDWWVFGERALVYTGGNTPVTLISRNRLSFMVGGFLLSTLRIFYKEYAGVAKWNGNRLLTGISQVQILSPVFMVS